MTVMPAAPVLRTFVQYLTAFCSRPEITSDVMCSRFVRPVVRDKRATFREPRLNRSREISPEVVGGVIFGSFSNPNNYLPEVASDVIACVVIDLTSAKVCMKFGDYR